MGLPLLGVIPHINGRDPKQNITIPKEETLITQSEPKSAVSESFRSLRTNLHFTAINKQKKIMLFTSTFQGEGKSVITANEAVVVSQTGARVLIIDCDLRRSSLHERFGHSKTPGLSEILTGDITFEEAKHITGIEGLDLITAGTTPPNPSELLGSEAMRQLLLSQRENYDYILIDAPPVLAVTDAPVLATISDIVILVMEAGRVPVKAAQNMRETLTTLQASFAGLVINDKTGKGESYGYYGSRYYRYGRRYGYGYGYGYRYGYYSDAEPKPQGKFNWLEELIPEKLRKKFKKLF
jgi:tyrosine-protein kinase Etk/Wzc